MRTLIFAFALGLSLLNVTCGRSEPANRPDQNANAAGKASRAGTATGTKSGEMGATSSHGGGTTAVTNGAATSGAGAAPAGGDADRALANTAEQDARIEKAAAKADAPGASAADRKAAAEAYLARGNVYRDAGNPRLYKFALGDYRRVLRYDPSNREAKEKMDEIVNIYQSMGRPVPTNGLEP
jgi:tetratricopeptide (TPR) repeat protein